MSEVVVTIWRVKAVTHVEEVLEVSGAPGL